MPELQSMTTITEKQFQSTLVEAIRGLGAMVYHTFDSRRSEPGFPDLTIVTRDRRLIFAELKTAKNLPTGPQIMWLDALPDHQAFLWRPDDFDDAVRIVQYGHEIVRDSFNYGVKAHEPTCIACQRRLT